MPPFPRTGPDASTAWAVTVNRRRCRLEKAGLGKSDSGCSPSEICGLEIFEEMIQCILSNLRNII